MGVFINLSNHISAKWSEKQKTAAAAYGQITDLPFPAIDPYFKDADIDRLVDTYYEKIMSYEEPVVMLQGEFVFTFRLVTRLKPQGIPVLAACSVRKATEYNGEFQLDIRDSQTAFEIVHILKIPVLPKLVFIVYMFGFLLYSPYWYNQRFTVKGRQTVMHTEYGSHSSFHRKLIQKAECSGHFTCWRSSLFDFHRT